MVRKFHRPQLSDSGSNFHYFYFKLRTLSCSLTIFDHPSAFCFSTYFRRCSKDTDNICITSIHLIQVCLPLFHTMLLYYMIFKHTVNGFLGFKYDVFLSFRGEGTHYTAEHTTYHVFYDVELGSMVLYHL